MNDFSVGNTFSRYLNNLLIITLKHLEKVRPGVKNSNPEMENRLIVGNR